MRSPVCVVLLVLLAVGASMSFEPKNYLYANESGATITNANFQQGGANYTIVSINGNAAFLLQNGQPLQDQATMTRVLGNYYTQTYYPTAAEIRQLNDYLLAYNRSKNAGTVNTPGEGDDNCRDALFIDGRIMNGNTPVVCVDDASCTIAASYLFEYGSVAFGWGSPSQILDPLENYSYASYGSEKLMNQDFAALATLNASNVYQNLQSIQSSIPTLRGYEYDMKSSPFRSPDLNDPNDVASCEGVCWGLCPPLKFDSTQLQSLDSALSSLISQVAPLASQTTTGSGVYASTMSRLEAFANKVNTTYYTGLYSPLVSVAGPVMASAQTTNSLIQNASLQANLSALESLNSGINSSISSGDFGSLDTELARYQALIPVVNNLSTSVFSVYNASLGAKTRADTMAFVLEATDLDPLARADADTLKNRTNMLDAGFANGLPEQTYVNLTKNYTDVYSQSQALLRQTRENPGAMLLLSFRSFAGKINQGLADSIGSAKLMPLNKVPQNRLQVFGLFSLATFLSLGSLCLLAFLSILALRQFTTRSSRYILLVLFLLSMLSVSTFAAFMYVYLDKTSSHADVGEFLADAAARNSSTVLIDTQTASALAVGPMQSCGDSIAQALVAGNKTVTLLYLGPSGCTEQSGPSAVSVTKAGCLGSLANASSAILLNYSSSSEVSDFSVIYRDRADIAAGVQYYDSCPLASLESDFYGGAH